ncbi:hypothetical protein LCGC14_1090610 [marine sediment metagenome]|uniref:Cdc6 C-terminal domain-containing protein n=1 Tax=marine sediment metagenome TaxID=412755 RepID=A0A0F9PVM2_9ZZZZ
MGRKLTEITQRMVLKLSIDSGRKGLLTIFKAYQVRILEYLWELQKDGQGKVASGKVWKHLIDTPEEMSRASVIFFLNDLVSLKLADYTTATGKGGHHRVYFMKYTEEEFWVWLADKVKETLLSASGIPGEQVTA